MDKENVGTLLGSYLRWLGWLVGGLPEIKSEIPKLLPALPRILDNRIRAFTSDLPSTVNAIMGGQMGKIFLKLFETDKPFTVCGDKRFTYREARDRMLRLTNGLIDLGWNGKNIAILSRNSNEYLETIFIPPLLLGCRCGMINFHLRSEELKGVIENTGPQFLLVEKEFLPEVEKAKLTTIDKLIVIGEDSPGNTVLYDDLIKSSSTKIPDITANASIAPGPMYYTGGTSGLPKGVNSAGALLNSALPTWNKPRPPLLDIFANLQYIYGLGREKITNIDLCAGPLYHAGPMTWVLITIILGGKSVIMRTFDGEGALRLIEQEKVSSLFAVPTIVRRMLMVPNKAEYDVSSLKSLSISGAPCQADLKREAVEYFGPVVYEFYSSSDLSLQTILKPEHYLANPKKIESQGKVIPGVRLKILDENGKECPPGKVGDVYISNFATALLEYYRDPEKTKSTFIKIGGEKFAKEGQLSYIDEDGFYYFVQRTTDIIISGGVNIYPDEIEAVLYKHPKVADVCVIGVPDLEWGESVKAIIELKNGEHATEEEIIEFCKEHLASYKRPKSVEFWDKLPRSLDGKLLKRIIKEKYQKRGK